jgi:hypothetical protein
VTPVSLRTALRVETNLAYLCESKRSRYALGVPLLAASRAVETQNTKSSAEVKALFGLGGEGGTPLLQDPSPSSGSRGLFASQYIESDAPQVEQ